MKSMKSSAAAAAVLALSACGLLSGHAVDYSKGAEQMPALDVPPDLTRPATVDTYKLPRVLSASAVPALTVAADVSIQVEESGVSSILIQAPFDRSWRRVGLALERLQLQLDDKDRSKGIYYLKPNVAGGRVEVTKSTAAVIAYRVQVRDGGQSCSVLVSAADGMSDEGSKALLDALYKNIQP